MKTDSRKYRITIYGCFLAYIVQAIVNNFVPLLFVTFHETFSIPLSQITFLITLNFLIQISVDLLSAFFVDRIGYRASMISACGLSIAGLVLLGILPDVLSNKYVALMISVIIYAIGGGLLEVIVSPIVESCPSDNKEAEMSLLHSFYCWGHVGVVLLSTLYFSFIGISNWKILSFLWAIVPFLTLILFCFVPMASTEKEEKASTSFLSLFKDRSFWLFILMMFCAGASEQAVSQWASAFAELGLNVSKTMGDLLGPLTFAALMGTSRAIYGNFGKRLNLEIFMKVSLVLCIISYLMIALIPNPVCGLIGCAICGFSVGILWPGTFSKASSSIPNGGTMLFAFLALAGDLGCCLGPTFAGEMTALFNDNFHYGIGMAIIFPLVLLLFTFLSNRKKAK